MTHKRALEENGDAGSSSANTKRLKSFNPLDASFPIYSGELSPTKGRETKTGKVVCDTEDDAKNATATAKSPKKDKKATDAGEEKRLRRFRPKAPGKFRDIHHRAMTQRMFAIERTRSGTEECPQETVKLAGTTGNIYTVRITKEPTCNCPHALSGNQCKHIVYVMAKVLKAPENLQYQLALLSSELREILAHAPPILTEENTSDDGKRKPVEGDCPICYCEFEANEKVVWCKAACGNNIHEECLGRWAATRRDAGGVTCPLCRTPWMGDEDMVKNVMKFGGTNTEGYVNVASELGLSGQRDYSTYNSFWVRRQQRAGVDVGDWRDSEWV